jgi:hypothetical protein
MLDDTPIKEQNGYSQANNGNKPEEPSEYVSHGLHVFSP